MELGDVEVFHVESAQQHADILTKPLGRGSFELHRDFLFGKGLMMDDVFIVATVSAMAWPRWRDLRRWS